MSWLLLLLTLGTMARAEPGDFVSCQSDEYRGFLSGLDRDLFRSSVNFCLDHLRAQSTKRNSEAAPPPSSESASPFRPVPVSALPTGCAQGDLGALKSAIRNQLKNCERFKEEKLSQTMKFGCRAYTRREWCLDANRKLLGIAESAADFADYMARVRDEFDWYRQEGWKDGKFKGKVQFTGYYAPPAIEARSAPDAEFNYAIYRKPHDLVAVPAKDARFCGTDAVTGRERRVCRQLDDGTLEPFFDKNAIDNQGALKGRGLEIAWVKDPVAVAFLMIEGSGSLNIRQPDGSVVHQKINYEAANGRTLHMLSRILTCLGAKPNEANSMTAIKKYLADRPDRVREILAFDQSYIFFRADNNGPFGADDIPITAKHSFATDRRILPTGTPILFQTPRPGGAKDGCSDLSSMGIAQDSGGAIVGPHVDWYFGEGEAAQSEGEAMNQAGDLFVALPKGGGKEVPGCELK